MHTKQIVICKCTCTGMRLANHEKESPLMYIHVYIEDIDLL